MKNFKKKLLLLAVVLFSVVAVVAYAAGWISFSSSDGKSSITIDAREIREDTEKVIGAGKDLLDRTK